MRNTLLFLISLILLCSGGLVTAQEEDPYADYSYLWEKTEKKKKRKKKKDIVEPIQQESATDLPSVEDPLKLTSPQDSVTNLTSSPEETTSSGPEDIEDPSETAILPDFTAEEPVSDLEDIVPQESRKTAPSDDFRAGLPGSEPESSINAGLNFTSIGGQYFIGLTLAPEFSLGKMALGLHVPILYGLDDKSVRTEIFEGGVGPLRLIRYVRYGAQKLDPYYFRLGELDQLMLGFGSLVNNYTNTTSYERRKFGLHFDVNYRGLGGIEGLYSDFDPSSLNLLAIRPYVRPLATTGIPVASTLEIGSAFIWDKDQTKLPASDSTSTTYTFTEPGISAFGIDAGITVVKVPFIQIDLFAGFAKLNVSSQVLRDTVATIGALPGAPDVLSDGFKNGQGINAGVNFRFHFIANVMSTDLRIERLNYKDHYIPQFFDATYELNKDLRIFTLGSAERKGGIYGSLTGHVLQKVKLGGSLMIPDDISASSPALVRVHADLERLANKISLHASYVKGNLDTLKDAFKLDERSLAKVRFVYYLNKFITAGVDYYWSFAIDENGAYKATSYVSPYFGVSIQL